MFAKSRVELESLLKVVKLFSSSICMNFGLNKCATTSVMRGKLVESSDMALSDDVIYYPSFGCFGFIQVFGNV